LRNNAENGQKIADNCDHNIEPCLFLSKVLPCEMGKVDGGLRIFGNGRQSLAGSNQVQVTSDDFEKSKLMGANLNETVFEWHFKANFNLRTLR
jgi:hypothetical protein